MILSRTKRPVGLATALLTLAAGSNLALAGTGADPTDAHSIGAANKPLVLTLKGPSGDLSSLTYIDHDGWQLDERNAAHGSSYARLTRASEERRIEASVTERPLSVLIDGPTGFTYVWVRDKGWKFVGQFSEHER